MSSVFCSGKTAKEALKVKNVLDLTCNVGNILIISALSVIQRKKILLNKKNQGKIEDNIVNRCYNKDVYVITEET